MATGRTSDVNFETFDFDSVATKDKYIDKGAFGEVYGPYDWNGSQCAFKRIRFSAGKGGDELRTKVKANKSTWTSVKHEHLINIYDVILQPTALYVVMEYAGGGTLRLLLDKPDVTVQRQIDVSNWATQIAKGMMYLHEKNIIHRDLKSDNIMLMKPFDAEHPHKETTLKITDFDDARESQQTATLSFRGTVAYMAPEIFTTERFSKACDVFSYGVVVWEMLTGKRPHDDVAQETLMQSAVSGQQRTLPVPVCISDTHMELLNDCLHQDKRSRPPFKEIIDRLNGIGKKKDKAQSGYKSNPDFVSIIRPNEANKSICGLTILDKELFVVSEESSEVAVYKLRDFTFSRRWNLKALIRPQDIVSCNRFTCLYILCCTDNYQSMEILRVDKNGKSQNDWSTGNDHGKSLSITYESNIIFTVFSQHKLNEYSPAGQLIRAINLSQSIRFPNHAMQLTNGHFVVSYGDVVDELDRLCITDGDGKLRKLFGGSLVRPIEKSSRPVHLTIEENGVVMVADQWNHLVLLSESDLELKGEIHLNDNVRYGLREPTAILLDESTDLLFVADNEPNNNQQIVIFEI